MTEALATALEALAPELTKRVLDTMYEDPFWLARYGARGRKHAEADSRYHVSYLAEALRSSDPRVMTRYATWLRSVLVSRGMSSQHLAENFALLASALSDALPRTELACAYLDEARAALRYEQGLAYWLEQHEQTLLEGTLGALPAEPSRSRQLREWFGHFVDSVHCGRPGLFQQHVQWLTTYRSERGEPALHEELMAFDRALAEVCDLPSTDRRQLLSHLRTGVATNDPAAAAGKPSTSQ